MVQFSLQVDRVALIRRLHESRDVVQTLTSPESRTSMTLVSSTADDSNALRAECIRHSQQSKAFVEACRRRAQFQRDATRVMFEAYCDRKSILKEEQNIWESCILTALHASTAQQLQDRLLGVVIVESQERQQLMDAYHSYVEWISNKETANAEMCRNRERARIEYAQRVAAAQDALMEDQRRRSVQEQELRLRAIRELEDDGRRRAEAQKIEKERQASAEAELRMQAAMQAAVQARQELELRQQEENKKLHLMTMLDSQQREIERRLHEREQARIAEQQQREADRKMLLEHVTAEEEILKQRLSTRESEIAAQQVAEKQALLQRLAEEASALQMRLEARQQEAVQQQQARNMLLEHCAAEEALLISKMKQRETEAAAAEERRRTALLAELAAAEAELAAKHAQREERDNILRAQHEAMESFQRQQQLAFLQQQESKLTAKLSSQSTASAPPQFVQAPPMYPQGPPTAVSAPPYQYYTTVSMPMPSPYYLPQGATVQQGVPPAASQGLQYLAPLPPPPPSYPY